MGAYTAALACSRVEVEELILVAPMIPAPGEAPTDFWVGSGELAAAREMAEREGRDPDAEFDVVESMMHDLPQELIDEAFARGEPEQADKPFSEPFPLGGVAGGATRVILAARDRILPLEFMRGLVRERLGPDVPVDEIDAGHLPALARPAELARLLVASGRGSALRRSARGTSPRGANAPGSGPRGGLEERERGPAHQVAGLVTREPGDVGEPDERLDAAGAADREREPAQLRRRRAPASAARGRHRSSRSPCPFAARARGAARARARAGASRVARGSASIVIRISSRMTRSRRRSGSAGASSPSERRCLDLGIRGDEQRALVREVPVGRRPRHGGCLRGLLDGRRPARAQELARRGDQGRPGARLLLRAPGGLV